MLVRHTQDKLGKGGHSATTAAPAPPSRPLAAICWVHPAASTGTLMAAVGTAAGHTENSWVAHMNRLLDIGFHAVGHWELVDGELSFELLRHGSQRNILYAFVSDGDVKYVGKTVQPLTKRLYGYKNPGSSQSTNIKNNARIKELLRSGAAVDILALPDNGLLHYGQFHVNLAAGLEDSIIAVLQPEWNGQPKKAAENEPLENRPPLIDSFSIVLHKTYFNSGFFNVPVAHTESLGAHGEQIDILCGTTPHPITGAINRRCNTNNAPRIMGGVGLRDWFQANAKVMGEIHVGVFSPNEIQVNANAG